MYAPPATLSGADLPRLIPLIGGRAAACSLLDVSPRTLRRWLAGDLDPPPPALRLLWYAGPWGRGAAEADMWTELQWIAVERDALRDQLAAARLELDSPAPARITLDLNLRALGGLDFAANDADIWTPHEAAREYARQP